MSRDWTAARAKVDAEGQCRVCSVGGRLEAAHVMGVKYDPKNGPVDPVGIVPLCRGCHADYDLNRLDLLPHLYRDEQAHAVSLVGIMAAFHKITGQRTPLVG